MDKEYIRLKNFIKSFDDNKPIVMFQSLFNTYRKNIDYIIHKFISSQRYNIIFVYNEPKGYSCEKLDCAFLIKFEFDLKDVDLVIIDDSHNRHIDTCWGNTNAPRLLLSHNVILGHNRDYIDYIAVPSKFAYKRMKYSKNNLLKVGYPKLDVSIKEYNKVKSIKEDAILYAPTLKNLDGFGDIEYLKQHIKEYNYSIGFDYYILKILLDNFDETIIYRPHPFHQKRNHLYIQLVMQKFKNESRIILSDDYIKDYKRAKVMVSDLSQTPYTFSLTTLKPIVTFVPSTQKRGSLDSELADKFGFRIKNLSAMVDKIKYLLKYNNKFSKKIEKYRDKNIYNIKNSTQCLIEEVYKIVN